MPLNASSVTYAVRDEYGQVQPAGAIVLKPDGTYSLTIKLQASRRGEDGDGRRYDVTVRAETDAGDAGSATRTVTVSHNR
jgi:hypothetical protein